MIKKSKWLFIVFFYIFLPLTASAFDHQHGLFDILLKKHVVMKDDGKASQVDYKAIANDKALIGTYLGALSSVNKSEFDTWDKRKQLAFLINTYNAYTIDLVARNYPVKSIKDIGSMLKSTWAIRFIPLFGQKRSLDELEHEIIRKKGVYDEPRIHVALVCAAIGCPALRNEAYTYDNLDAQLEKALVLFLSDKSRNRYDSKEKKFHVSPIFKWYEADFKDKYGSLEKFFLKYPKQLSSNEQDMAVMKQGGSSVVFGDYNWKLNER